MYSTEKWHTETMAKETEKWKWKWALRRVHRKYYQLFFVCFVYRSCCKYNIVEHTMVNQFWRWCCWCNNNQWVRIWWMESMAGHLQLLRALHLPLKFRYSYIFNGRVFSVNAPHSLDTESEFRTLYLVWVCDNDIHSCCLSPPECGNSTNLFNAFFGRTGVRLGCTLFSFAFIQ